MKPHRAQDASLDPQGRGHPGVDRRVGRWDPSGGRVRMIRSARRWGWVLALACVAGGLTYGGWRLLRPEAYRTALVEIREQIQAGRHGAAARNLTALLAWEPGSDEATYLLGLCEKARGRTEAAAAAWARIPAHSPFAVPATWAGP